MKQIFDRLTLKMSTIVIRKHQRMANFKFRLYHCREM